MFKFNWQYRIIAVILALFFWYLVSGQEKVDIWLNVPVEVVNLPAEHVLRTGMVSSVRVRVRGTSTVLNRVETARLHYSLDLSSAHRGTNMVQLDPKNINLPRAVEVVEIEPPVLELEVDRRVSRLVPVNVNWQAHISPDFELLEVSVEPETVQVRGPERILETLEEIETNYIEIREETPRRIIKRAGLDLYPDIESTVGEVLVEFSFGPVLEEIWVRKDILVLADEGMEFTLEQNYARANLALPGFLLRSANWRDRITYYIRLDQDMEPGEHEVEVLFELPRDGKVVESRPETILVEIK